MFPQHKAITRLLLDDDPATVELTKQQLLEGGAKNIPDLLDLMAGANGKLGKIIRELVTAIEVTDAREEFTKTCRSISSLDDLEEICWLLAKVFLPGINLTRYRGLLDEWADEVRRRSESLDSEADQLGFLPEFFGTYLGFRGNSDGFWYSGLSFVTLCHRFATGNTDLSTFDLSFCRQTRRPRDYRRGSARAFFGPLP